MMSEFVPVEKGKGYYFKDKNGNINKETVYDNVFNGGFVDGLAVVSKDSKHYYINEHGIQVGGPYKTAHLFQNGFAVVKKENGDYFINENFEEVAGPYEFAFEFQRIGLAIVKKEDGFYYINKSFEEVGGPYLDAERFEGNLAIVRKDDGKCYYVNNYCETVSDGYDTYSELRAVLLKAKYKNACLRHEKLSKEERAKEYVLYKDCDGEYYYESIKGIVGGETFLLAYPFDSNGLAHVRKKDGKEYIINGDFEVIIGPCNFIGKFNKYGLVKVSTENDEDFYLNSKGEKVGGPYLLTETWDLPAGVMAKVKKDDGKWYYINENCVEVSLKKGPSKDYKVRRGENADGDEVSYYIDEVGNYVGNVYQIALGFEENGLARVKKEDGKWYFINGNFEEVAGPYVYTTEFETDGLALVKKDDGKYYFINENLKEVSGPYVVAYDFEANGLARVKKEDGKWCFINGNFEEVFGPYLAIHKMFINFQNVLGVQTDNGEWFIVNKDFEKLAGPYNSIVQEFDMMSFCEVQKDDGIYHIGKDFQEVGGPYKQTFCCEKNGLLVVEDNDGKYYYINGKGEKLGGPYLGIETFENTGNGLAIVETEDGKFCYINELCNIVGGPYESIEDMEKENIEVIIANAAQDKARQKTEQDAAKLTPMQQYLNGDLDVYNLPDDCFEGDNLNIIIDNEKKQFQWLMSMAKTKEQMEQIKAESLDKADFVKGRAAEINALKNTVLF